MVPVKNIDRSPTGPDTHPTGAPTAVKPVSPTDPPTGLDRGPTGPDRPDRLDSQGSNPTYKDGETEDGRRKTEDGKTEDGRRKTDKTGEDGGRRKTGRRETEDGGRETEDGRREPGKTGRRET